MRTALIVGASRGLGRGLAVEHARRGWDVVGTVRRPEDHDTTTEGLRTEILDMTDWAGIDAFRDRLRSPIDLLLVSGGIDGPLVPIGQADPVAFADTMLVNTLAPLRIAERLGDLVPASGTIAVMSSAQGSVTLADQATKEAYRISKAGLNMGLRLLCLRDGARRTHLALNPGWVRTDMGTQYATLSVEDSVEHLADVLAAHRGRGGIAFLDYDDSPLPW